MSAMSSQITGVSIVFSNVCSGADQRKHQSSASGLYEGNSPVTVNSPHKRSVARKMFPFDDVIMRDTNLNISIVTGTPDNEARNDMNPSVMTYGKNNWHLAEHQSEDTMFWSPSTHAQLAKV